MFYIPFGWTTMDASSFVPHSYRVSVLRSISYIVPPSFRSVGHSRPCWLPFSVTNPSILGGCQRLPVQTRGIMLGLCPLLKVSLTWGFLGCGTWLTCDFTLFLNLILFFMCGCWIGPLSGMTPSPKIPCYFDNKMAPDVMVGTARSLGLHEHSVYCFWAQ